MAPTENLRSEILAFFLALVGREGGERHRLAEVGDDLAHLLEQHLVLLRLLLVPVLQLHVLAVALPLHDPLDAAQHLVDVALILGCRGAALALLQDLGRDVETW